MAKAKELSKRPKEETETPERTETLLSLDGLRKYECISEKQKEEACKALRVVPQSVKEHNMTTLLLQVALKSVVPSFSFGAASLNGCTITKVHAYKPAGDSD